MSMLGVGLRRGLREFLPLLFCSWWMKSFCFDVFDIICDWDTLEGSADVGAH